MLKMLSLTERRSVTINMVMCKWCGSTFRWPAYKVIAKANSAFRVLRPSCPACGSDICPYNDELNIAARAKQAKAAEASMMEGRRARREGGVGQG